MGIYEFNILSEEEQYDLVFTKGQCIDVVIEGEIRYALYAVSMFWVEVTYKIKDNKITGVKSFIGGETLDKYSHIPKEL